MDAVRSRGPIRLVASSVLLVLVSLAVIAGLLTVLDAHLADAAVVHFDRGMQFEVHGWANGVLNRVMRALTWIGSIKVFLSGLGVAVAFLLGLRKSHAAALLGLPMPGALALNELLKLHFHRARPTVAWAIGDEHTFSFPSGHSLFSVVLYGSVAYVTWRLGAPAWGRVVASVAAGLMPLAIGLSRIYLGMHFPTDVLAGYLVGLVWLATAIGVDWIWVGERGMSVKA